MGIVERKEKQKLEIRKMILEASMKLFVEEGFAHVSIRKIADLIEYSPTTVYLYFKDKDEIFFSLHEMGFLKMQELNRNYETPLSQREVKRPKGRAPGRRFLAVAHVLFLFALGGFENDLGAAPGIFYVAPNGNDQWTGNRGSANWTSTAG